MSTNISSTTNASASTNNDRAIIFYSDYNVVVSNDGTIHWQANNCGSFRECPAYTLLYQFSPKDTGQSKVK